MELPKPLLVAAGGVTGAAARWLVFEILDHDLWALTGVNTVGAFVLGALAQGAFRDAPSRGLLLGVGFTGAFTTFSTLALEIATRLDAGQHSDAGGLAIVSVALGLAAAALGASTERRIR